MAKEKPKVEETEKSEEKVETIEEKTN